MNNTPDRLNNFDALRLSAAFLVLISHQFALSGFPEPTVASISLGTLGVQIFFSISGFLVSQSWRQDPHFWRFLAKRFLRIWPGMAVFTLLAAFLLGPIVTTLNLRDYVADPNFSGFFNTLKLLSVRGDLPGVFETNILPRAVNGSLWTIPLEVRCYFLLLLLGIVGLAKRPYIMALGTVLLGIYYFRFAPDPTDYQFHYALYFFAGLCFDLFRKKWEERIVPPLTVICLLAGLLYLMDAPRVAALLLIATFSIIFGSRSTPIVNKFGRFGDFSYGVYIYAFAVQQTFMWYGGKSYPFMLGLLITSVTTVLCAYLSWHFVENPALGLKSRLKTARINWPNLHS